MFKDGRRLRAPDKGVGDEVNVTDRRLVPVIEIVVSLTLLGAFVKHGDTLSDRDFRPEDLWTGVSVGVGRLPHTGLMMQPEVSAKGLKFRLAGR
jgi:hypothetical protein